MIKRLIGEPVLLWDVVDDVVTPFLRQYFSNKDGISFEDFELDSGILYEPLGIISNPQKEE